VKDPLIDQVLAGRFRVRSRIGEGGMSVVYLGRDETSGGEVALKVLHRHLLDQGDFLARFHQEARTAGKLDHANAVRVFDSGDHEGLPYIAMEYCGGRSLKRIIREEAPLEPGRAADLATQILEALAAAHRVGIIHRDLKPENVRVANVGGKEVVKVLDFGVAKFVGTDEIKEMTGAIKTKTGVVFGTPKYMAPEQIMGEEIDSRIDVYAAGVILYEMLSGVPPFESEDLYGFVTKHLHQPAPPLRERVPDLEIPDALEHVVLRALSKQREARPDDAGSLARELMPFAVRTRTSVWVRYGVGAAGVLLGGALGAGAAYEIGKPGVELAAAAGSLGVFGAAGFLFYGRTSSRNLVLRLLLVLVGTAAVQGGLWAAGLADLAWAAGATLGATLVLLGLCVARGMGGRWLRPLVGAVTGALGGALLPVPQGPTFVRLWDLASFDGETLKGLLALTAVGALVGLGGMLLRPEGAEVVVRGRATPAPATPGSA
jgi:predicted Ser/Thr protein kinase